MLHTEAFPENYLNFHKNVNFYLWLIAVYVCNVCYTFKKIMSY